MRIELARLETHSAAGLILPCLNTEAMELHLAEIAKTVTTDAHALLIVDGAGWHDAKDLSVPDNITLLKLPPYAPELNPMENVWQYLRVNKLAITVFDTHDEILDKCSDAWNFFANDPERLNSITHRDWITVKPKFSSWGKEVLCQVVDVEPITVLGNFKNG